MITRSLLTLALALSALTINLRAADSPILIKDGQTVVFMGDSITAQGWGVPGGYVKLFVAGLETLGIKITPVPVGIGGQTSREMVARVDRDIIGKKPQWLTLSCGVNDVWHGEGGVNLEQYKKNITSIVDQAQAAGIKVILLTSTPIGEDLPNDNNKKLVAYNDFLHQLAQERKLPLADENAAFQAAITAANTPGMKVLTNDGVHPISDGHQLMAKTLLTAVGATPADIAKVEQAWLDAPDSANISAYMTFRVGFPITIRQYNALKKAATERKTTVDLMLNALFIDAVVDTAKAHAADPTPAPSSVLEGDSQKAFHAKVDALTAP